MKVKERVKEKEEEEVEGWTWGCRGHLISEIILNWLIPVYRCSSSSSWRHWNSLSPGQHKHLPWPKGWVNKGLVLALSPSPSISRSSDLEYGSTVMWGSGRIKTYTFHTPRNSNQEKRVLHMPLLKLHGWWWIASLVSSIDKVAPFASLDAQAKKMRQKKGESMREKVNQW